VRVLVTGAGGQLGRALLDAFADYSVAGLARAELDVTDEAAVVAAVRDHEPDLVVNAAAWTDVDSCEADPGRAHRVNAVGPWWLARACRLAGAALVHVSTDYVFGAAPRDRPYTEFDPPDPVNEYGRSKAAGEALVRETLREHYVVRTSGVFGAGGSSFVATMLRLGEEKAEVSVVDDQEVSPTYTRDLAAAIRELAVTGRYGTYHRTASGSCTWLELAAATFELAGLEVEIRAITSADLDRPAPRPAYTVLSPRHSLAAGLREMPHWRDGLARFLDELGRARP
jgi:dTDP-4-dehydrorhamnose reductase